jgi:hypothetical protein
VKGLAISLAFVSFSSAACVAETGTGTEAGLQFSVIAQQEGSELMLTAETINISDRNICIASISVYPTNELDEFGSTSFESISEDASPFFFSNYSAVLLPLGSGIKITSRFKILPPSAADRVDFMGASIEEQTSLRNAIRDVIRRGEYEFGISGSLIECPRTLSLDEKSPGSPVIVKFPRKLRAVAISGFDVVFGNFKLRQ